MRFGECLYDTFTTSVAANINKIWASWQFFICTSKNMLLKFLEQFCIPNFLDIKAASE